MNVEKKKRKPEASLVNKPIFYLGMGRSNIQNYHFFFHSKILILDTKIDVKLGGVFVLLN